MPLLQLISLLQIKILCYLQLFQKYFSTSCPSVANVCVCMSVCVTTARRAKLCLKTVGGMNSKASHLRKVIKILNANYVCSDKHG